MKIVRCPKGGKVPQGYCKLSCLNYSIKHLEEKEALPPRKPKDAVIRKAYRCG